MVVCEMSFREGRGEMDYHQVPDADVDSVHCLLCITTPKSDLTLVV
jgi:hypothetical protein